MGKRIDGFIKSEDHKDLVKNEILSYLLFLLIELFDMHIEAGHSVMM